MESLAWIAPAVGVAAVVAGLLLALRHVRRSHAELTQSLDLLAKRLHRLESIVNAPLPHAEAARSRLHGPSRHAGRRGPGSQQSAERGSGAHRETLIAVPLLEAEGDPAAGGSDLERRHGEIAELAASGAGPDEIVRQTGQPIGQVDLILGLLRRLPPKTGPRDHE